MFPLYQTMLSGLWKCACRIWYSLRFHLQIEASVIPSWRILQLRLLSCEEKTIRRGRIDRKKIVEAEFSVPLCSYRARVISIVLTLLGVAPSSLGANCWVPISTVFILTSGRNRRLTISTTSTARLMALPLALTFTSFAPPWKTVIHANTYFIAGFLPIRIELLSDTSVLHSLSQFSMVFNVVFWYWNTTFCCFITVKVLSNRTKRLKK